MVARGCGEGEMGSHCLCFCLARWGHSGDKLHSSVHVFSTTETVCLEMMRTGKSCYVYFITI